MKEKYIAHSLKINGIVQGVGFRPFVYQLAKQYNLTGEIANTSSGVSVHIEGMPGSIEAFSKDLVEKGPPLAQITEIQERPEPLMGMERFSIVKSRGQSKVTTLISPDVSICHDCL
ncbi:MAG: acylphosphatase, partial [Deltaproteobacteria bacterium]|nr:acylphosphatase [Deltaproteobacteria bacterium]